MFPNRFSSSFPTFFVISMIPNIVNVSSIPSQNCASFYTEQDKPTVFRWGGGEKLGRSYMKLLSIRNCFASADPKSDNGLVKDCYIIEADTDHRWQTQYVVIPAAAKLGPKGCNQKILKLKCRVSWGTESIGNFELILDLSNLEFRKSIFWFTHHQEKEKTFPFHLVQLHDDQTAKTTIIISTLISLYPL